MIPLRAVLPFTLLVACAQGASGSTTDGGGSFAYDGGGQTSEAGVRNHDGAAPAKDGAKSDARESVGDSGKHDAAKGSDATSTSDGGDAASSSDAPGEACIVTTCAATGAVCGAIPDGCGGTLTCGFCNPPESCGGGGTMGACGCTPSTCATLGENCGSPSDGCGGTLSCGTCSVPETCGGAGATGVCGAPCGILAPGSQLAAGASLVSCDGRFSLVMQATDGNLVLYYAGTGLWSSDTAGYPGAFASMQTDGNFVVYDGADGLWSSDSAGNPGAYLAVQSDGNVVVYASSGSSLWSSGTCCY